MAGLLKMIPRYSQELRSLAIDDFSCCGLFLEHNSLITGGPLYTVYENEAWMSPKIFQRSDNHS